MMHAMTSPESMKAAADRDAYAVSGPGDARSGGGAVGSVQSCKQCREIESGGPIETHGRILFTPVFVLEY
jgi:hypothetical protein